MRLPRSIQLAYLACASLLSLNSHVLAIGDGQPVRARASHESATILERTVRLVVREHEENYRFICSGFLLDDSILVTAANCLIPHEAEAEVQGRVYAEMLSGTPNVYRRPIRVFSLNETQEKSLAAATLKNSPEFTSVIPIANEDCDKNSEYEVVGFGIDQDERLPAKPMRAKYELLNSGSREFRLKRTSGFACAGDAGAPIFCKVKGKLALAGLVNAVHIDPNGQPESPKLTAKVCESAQEIKGTKLILSPRYQAKVQ